MGKINQNKVIIGIGILLIVGFAAAFVFTQRKSAQQASESTSPAQAETTSSLQNNELAADVLLPDYAVQEFNLLDGIPRFTSLNTTIPKRPTVDTATYTVQQGDNLFLIADKYGLALKQCYGGIMKSCGIIPNISAQVRNWSSCLQTVYITNGLQGIA
jgi:hypothetical protein